VKELVVNRSGGSTPNRNWPIIPSVAGVYAHLVGRVGLALDLDPKPQAKRKSNALSEPEEARYGDGCVGGVG